jgi:hypothetical protein
MLADIFGEDDTDDVEIGGSSSTMGIQAQMPRPSEPRAESLFVGLENQGATCCKISNPSDITSVFNCLSLGCYGYDMACGRLKYGGILGMRRCPALVLTRYPPIDDYWL